MRGPGRIARGLLTDAARPVGFRFDGRPMRGLAGDTLASALLANGKRLVARSFKYHRPRGIVTSGPEEPCALVDVIGNEGREPNRLATTLPLYEGLQAQSQNRWPSLELDARALTDLVARFLPAGFYYKTFMAPAWAWERLYEPLIRRAAGLGTLRPSPAHGAAPAQTVHDHVDVLVVGAGACGLAAARRLAASGMRVVLADQDAVLGGGTLLNDGATQWREAVCAELAGCAAVRSLLRTTVIGAYGHGVFAALEELAPAETAAHGGLRERLRVIRARRVVLATGALERLIAFPGNDLPGVMLAGAALGFLRRYGVAVGRRPAFFLNTDEAYEAVFALASAGIGCAGVIDVRASSLAADRARAQGIEVHGGAVVDAVSGGKRVRSIEIAGSDGRRWRIDADCLLMSGGYSPATALASQLGAQLRWQEAIAAFSADLDPAFGQVAGAARGIFGLAAAARDGEAAARAIAEALRPAVGAAGPAGVVGAVGAAGAGAVRAAVELPPDPEVTPIAPLWEVRGRGKAFVDLQNDVTAADVRLAVREGYTHVEHMKRYTTHGMATDQGRVGGVVGSAVLAEARGVPLAAVGMPKPRPFAQAVPFAALAGGEVGEHFKPKRRLALHDWHEQAGATFAAAGLWLRPLVYSRQSGWDPVLGEARAVRRSVGIADVSTLGKIDVQGADAARFLDFIYANTLSTLPIGRARYGIMLREDGMLLDDGTASRLAAEHFLVTTTTANGTAVFEHLEFHLQAVCPRFDVLLTDVADHWAQFAVAGPRSREVLGAVVAGIDLSAEAFPFMAAAGATIAGVAGRVFRISFSGELAYELAVPAQSALPVWRALLDAGRPFGIAAYGLDALNTLRIEKGHVTGAELNGNTNALDLGLQRMLKTSGDFVGRALSQRPGMSAPDRLQLVGVRPVDRTQPLRNGSQLVAASARRTSLGYVTSSTPSVGLEGWVGLALLAGGRRRTGERLIAASPIDDAHTEIEITSPHQFDPENVRVRA
ncbi:MAG TPA: 2Fe-2S iron-sulfur cluster-binding protein [Steroidobacteraceae bacterium]|nr:2Fe-2S iron-sulfur cluster-binding protein [Steroidobacteraceae bacterium]